MSNDEIKELIQLVVESGIAELEVQRGEDRVRIRRTHGVGGSSRRRPQPWSKPRSPHRRRPHLRPPRTSTSSNRRSSEHITTSPKPGDPAFVKVGDAVEPGQVLCIIESMKLMNEIESEIAGTVVAKLMENGRPVEYGEALFAIRPR